MKKVIITLVIIATVFGLTFLGIKIAKKNSDNNNPVPVYSLEYCQGGWYGDGSSIDGSVISEDSQNVYLTNESIVKSVEVSVGQPVKKGDVLLYYDTTLASLQINTKKTEIEITAANIKAAQIQLEKLKKTKPVDPPVEEPTEAPIDPEATPTDAPMDIPSGDINGGNSEDFEITYTKEELAAAIKEKEREIRDLELNKKMQELDLQKLEKDLEDGAVVSKIDGTVEVADVSDEKIASGEPSIVVRGDVLYKAIVNIDEWSLSSIEIGSYVSLFSYETGNSYDGEIEEILTTPNENYSSWGSVKSYYPVKISISGGDDLREYMWVQASLTGEANGNEGYIDAIILPKALVKQENGNYYVMKDDNGVLKKQYIKTGRTFYGTEIEIKSGLTTEDYIAFPFSKDATEGRKTIQKPMDDLYSY